MTETIQLTEEQRQAVEAAVQCLTGEGNLTLTIGGYAGTGKTTIIRTVLEDLAKHRNKMGRLPHIPVAAFTGKAVSVLRKKGIHSAQTLHSLMYHVVEDRDGKPVFTKRVTLDEEGRKVVGIIVDEASMLNESLYNDLLSYGLPVVFVGDHGQLEPIGDNPNVMQDPDIRLETVHRQASGSPILKLAHAFRQGAPVRWETVPKGCGLQRLPKVKALQQCSSYDVILCGFNKTRRMLNERVRHQLGRQEVVEKGERLICLRNNRQRGVFNGMAMTVMEVVDEYTIQNTAGDQVHCHQLVAVDDEGRERGILAYLVRKDDNPGKLNLKYWGEGDADYPMELVMVDYGYAITVHKSQGSEFDKVLVMEEIWHQKWDARRWRYTAATRASQELTWVV